MSLRNLPSTQRINANMTAPSGIVPPMIAAMIATNPWFTSTSSSAIRSPCLRYYPKRWTGRHREARPLHPPRRPAPRM